MVHCVWRRCSEPKPSCWAGASQWGETISGREMRGTTSVLAEGKMYWLNLSGLNGHCSMLQSFGRLKNWRRGHGHGSKNHFWQTLAFMEPGESWLRSGHQMWTLRGARLTKHFMVETQHPYWREVREEYIATIRQDLLYHVDRSDKEFA